MPVNMLVPPRPLTQWHMFDEAHRGIVFDALPFWQFRKTTGNTDHKRFERNALSSNKVQAHLTDTPSLQQSFTRFGTIYVLRTLQVTALFNCVTPTSYFVIDFNASTPLSVTPFEPASHILFCRRAPSCLQETRRNRSPRAEAKRGADMRALDQNQLADRWLISPRTLEQWRWRGIGPRYLKIGARVIYPVQMVEDFEATRLHANTVGPVTGEGG